MQWDKHRFWSQFDAYNEYVIGYKSDFAVDANQVVHFNHIFVLTYLLTHSLTHSLTYLLTHLLTHSLTYSLTHSLNPYLVPVSVNIMYELLVADPKYNPLDEPSQPPTAVYPESGPRHSSWYQLNALLSLGKYENAVQLLRSMDTDVITIDTYRRICITLASNNHLDYAEMIYQEAIQTHAMNQVRTSLNGR